MAPTGSAEESFCSETASSLPSGDSAMPSVDSDDEVAVIGGGGDEGTARVGPLHREGRRHRDGTGDLPAGGGADHRLYPAAAGGGAGRDVEARQAGRG